MGGEVARPDIPVVSLRDAADLLGISTRAAESALRNHGVRSGYPREAVEWLRDNRPGRGTRTDLNRGAMERNWTLTADMTARALADAVAEKLSGQIQPGVQGGRFATVTVRGGSEPPAWMTEIQRERPDADIRHRLTGAADSADETGVDGRQRERQQCAGEPEQREVDPGCHAEGGDDDEDHRDQVRARR